LLASSVENGGTVTSTASIACLRMICRAFRIANGTQTTCGSGTRRFLTVPASRDFKPGAVLPSGALGAPGFPGGEINPHNFCWTANGSSGVNE
jgi:hypothetical protein